MYAGSADDTLIAGTGDDTIAGAQPRDLIVYGSGTVTQLARAPYLNVSAGSPQTLNEGEPVTLTGSYLDPDDADTHTYLWVVTDPNGQSLRDRHRRLIHLQSGRCGNLQRHLHRLRLEQRFRNRRRSRSLPAPFSPC